MSTPISRSGRFAAGPDAAVQRYSESISFDWRLYPQDIAGSIAHATMLAKTGIITRRERDRIIKGLQIILREIARGQFRWKMELEDVHMNIESALTRRVPAAAKLHTGRSRNDQVATDLRLWVRDQSAALDKGLKNLQQSLLKLAARAKRRGSRDFLPIPGYTHLQRAQPVLAAHHLLAYVEMLARDRSRFRDAVQRANVCPLGAGALAGSSLPLDRRMTARLLEFREPMANSMDAVSDRDFVAEFLFVAALAGIHLSRLAEDLILWSSAEFAFIRIGDSHTTGSSLMPQKKNPDVAELGRGKSGRLIGNLTTLLTMLKGLPMTYNRDLQEDKPPLFDSAGTLRSTLEVFAGMLDATCFNPEACLRAVQDPNLLATELADHLVKRGLPFRKAHHLVGAAVQLAEQQDKTLLDLTRGEWKKVHPGLTDAARILRLDNALETRNRLFGAPGPRQVEAQLQRWKKLLRRVSGE
ncbi:MAG: argininosuccinate lyase [Verrucomicrobiae bacterium]|nr:argininosuccinate lyase [Verrucomicrobiae bacterium]